jgi:hypothetical protein
MSIDDRIKELEAVPESERDDVWVSAYTELLIQREALKVRS